MELDEGLKTIKSFFDEGQYGYTLEKNILYYLFLYLSELEEHNLKMTPELLKEGCDYAVKLFKEKAV